jgi:uncharacterized protein YbjT (DUF2867 family)
MGAEVVTGNLRDRASLDAAAKGAKTVISTVTIIGTAQEGDSFEDTDAAGTIALIEAAKAAGAKHFIFVSFDFSHFPETPLFLAKQRVEDHLKKGGIDYTILKPSPFMEVWLGPMLFGDPAAGPVKVYGQGDGRVPYISMFDVAEVTVRSVFAPSAKNATIEFSGPQGISQRGVVKEFETALSKPVEVAAVPVEALESKWESATNPFEKTFAGLMLGIARLDEGPRPPLQPDLAFEMATVANHASKAKH